MIKALIVDDSADLRLLLSKALENEGMSPFTADDGQDAIDKISAHGNPDIILLDLMMPVMDGFEFLKWKNNQADLANCPVIILSASTHNKLPEGATAFLQKPINLNKLVDLIETHCKLEK